LAIATCLSGIRNSTGATALEAPRDLSLLRVIHEGSRELLLRRPIVADGLQRSGQSERSGASPGAHAPRLDAEEASANAEDLRIDQSDFYGGRVRPETDCVALMVIDCCVVSCVFAGGFAGDRESRRAQQRNRQHSARSRLFGYPFDWRRVVGRKRQSN